MSGGSSELGESGPSDERAAILRKWFDLMMANQEDLAILMTVEQGKPLVALEHFLQERCTDRTELLYEDALR